MMRKLTTTMTPMTGTAQAIRNDLRERHQPSDLRLVRSQRDELVDGRPPALGCDGERVRHAELRIEEGRDLLAIELPHRLRIAVHDKAGDRAARDAGLGHH